MGFNENKFFFQDYYANKQKQDYISLKDVEIKTDKSPTQEREELQNLQSAALEVASNGIVITDINGKINWVNKAFTKLTGYSKEEVYNQNPRVLKSGIHDVSFYKDLWLTISAGEIWKGEITNKRKDGTLYTEEMTITPVRNCEDTLTNFIAIKQDITEKKIVGEFGQLFLTTDNLYDFFSGMHNQINKIINAPNLFIALLDSSKETLSFPYFTDQCDSKPKPRARSKGLSEYVIETGEPLRLTKDIFTKLVEEEKVNPIGTLPVSWIGVPLFLDSEASGILVVQSYSENLVYTDYDLNLLVSISNIASYAIERKTRLEAITNNEIKYKAITNTTKDAIITVNDKTNIVLWNKAAEKLFGYREEETLGRSTFDLVIPERFREESELRFKKVLGIGKDFKGTFNLIAKKKDGREFEVELSISLTEIGNDWFSTGIWRDISEKKVIKNSTNKEKERIIEALQTELAHVESNHNILNSIIDIVPQKIYVKNRNSEFIKVNKAVLVGMGISSENELLGKTDNDFFNAENAKEFIEEEKEIMKSGIPIKNKEHDEVFKNGDIGWGSTSKFPLYNNEGNSIGTFGITTDLTERKKNEDELRDYHYKFKKLIENSTLGILRIDEDGEIIMANPSMVKMLDYEKESDLIKQKSEKIYSSLKNSERFLQILGRENKISGFEDKMIKRDGTLIEVRENAWTIKDINDKIIYYEIIIEDITEQNQILKVLHESEFKYRMLIDKLSEAVFLSVDRKLELVNSRFLELFGFAEEELYSPDFDIQKYISLEIDKLDNERQRKCINENENKTTFEVTITTKSGKEKDVEVSISYLNYNGKIASQGVVRDLTDLKKQETQMRHLQKMEAIGTLAAGIAHEINTPSQFVSDNLSFLKDAYADIAPILNKLKNIDKLVKDKDQLNESIVSLDLHYLQEEIPKAIDQSIEGIGRIAGIVGAMRDFAHTGPKAKVSADLHKIIQNSITLSKNAWKYIAKIETNFAENLPIIVCQPNDINQVIVNMIINSSHAMEEKFANTSNLQGIISIQTIIQNDHIEIIVKDNGSGMPQKIMKRIFDLFYTTKEVGKGTGQGLAIAYDIIVTKHGGTIDVSSEEGYGTTFIIRLPIDQPVK